MATLHDFIDIRDVGRRDDTRYAAILLVKDCETGRVVHAEIEGRIFDPGLAEGTKDVWARYLEPACVVVRQALQPASIARPAIAVPQEGGAYMVTRDGSVTPIDPADIPTGHAEAGHGRRRSRRRAAR